MWWDKRPEWLDTLGAKLESIVEEAKRRDEEAKRRDEEVKRRDEEAKRRDEEYRAERAKAEEESRRRDEEYRAERAKAEAELRARIADMSAEVKGIGKSNGLFAEDIYYRTLWRKKEFAGIHFDDVSNAFGGIKKLPDGKRLQDQFDIVMLNDVSAAIIEAKYRARKDDVTTLVEKKVNNFKTLFPDFKNLKIYLGLAALAFEDDVVEEARKYGVGLLQQVGETVEYATDWEVRAY
jgi:hypothetical protein